LQGAQAAVVIPCKPLLFEQRRLIDADIESQGLEAAGRLANRGALATMPEGLNRTRSLRALLIRPLWRMACQRPEGVPH